MFSTSLPNAFGWTVVLFLAALSGASSNAYARSATLTWKDNSNNETGFEIERSSDGRSYSRIGLVGANVTQFVDTTAAPDTSYWYRVAAFNTFGRSGYSNSARLLADGASDSGSGSGDSGSGSGDSGSGSGDSGSGSGDSGSGSESDPDPNPSPEPDPYPEPPSTPDDPPQPDPALSSSGLLPQSDTYDRLAIDVADFEFERRSIAGFEFDGAAKRQFLARIAPSPFQQNSSLLAWQVDKGLVFIGANADWRSSENSDRIGQAIRELNLQPTNPFTDSALLFDAQPGEHIFLLNGTNSRVITPAFEFLSVEKPDLDATLRKLYLVSQVGSKSGGISVTFRITRENLINRCTLYATIPSFAEETGLDGNLRPAISLYSRNTFVGKHTLGVGPLDPDSPPPSFKVSRGTHAAAFQANLTPGIYTAIAYSQEGEDTHGILALEIHCDP